MSEDEEPDWLVEVAKNAEALRRQIDEGGEAMRRPIELLGRSVEQFVRDAQRANARSALLLLAQAVAIAVGEVVQQPKRPVAHERTASLTVTPVMTVTAEVAAAAGTAQGPTVYVYDEEVITRSEDASVEVRDSRRRGLVELNDGQILALVLVAIATWRLLVVPEQDWPAVDHYLTVLSFALPIAMFIWAKNNKRSK